MRAFACAVLLYLGCFLAACQSVTQVESEDYTPHKRLTFEVAPSVHLEVLDWGGQGSPIILIPGLAMTAHSFDTFGSELSRSHRVIGITRRGTGSSSAPPPTETNYSASQLGQDVLTVMDRFHINRAFLIGHSYGGEELSAIGTAHPERVCGLIYLDAGYDYAFYDPEIGNLEIDSRLVREELAQLTPGRGPLDQRKLLRDLLKRLPQLESLLRKELRTAENEAVSNDPPPPSLPASISAIMEGQEKFSRLNVPILAIFAYSGRVPKPRMLRSSKRRKEAGPDAVFTEEHVRTLKKLVPAAHVVRLSHADHFVFTSNQAQVLQEIENFVAPREIQCSEFMSSERPSK